MCTEFAFAALIILRVGGKWIYKEFPLDVKREAVAMALRMWWKKVSTQEEKAERQRLQFF